MFDLYSRDQTALISLIDFHRFIKDRKEPELEQEGIEVLKKVARKIF